MGFLADSPLLRYAGDARLILHHANDGLLPSRKVEDSQMTTYRVLLSHSFFHTSCDVDYGFSSRFSSPLLFLYTCVTNLPDT
ncbi:hypothetical protein BT93_K0776 [Corymbia citriodora subsp. variegata]|nr:hypothetical protein BT93_K0776 [Corymbia citriodora subsp. variegata]